MILQAGYDCYLTQAEDMPLSERRFENQVLINSLRMWLCGKRSHRNRRNR